MVFLEALLDLSRWVAGEPRWAGTAGKTTVEQESTRHGGCRKLSGGCGACKHITARHGIPETAD